MIAALLAMLSELPLGAIAGWLLAGGLTLLLLRRVLDAGRQGLLLARDRAALAAAYADLAASRATGAKLRSQLDAVLAGTFDGVQILDAKSRLELWNDRFPECTGMPPELLRVGMSLRDMLRGQAKAGEFGAVDVETEVTRRLALMQGSRELGVIERTRPNGKVVELRRNTLPDGGIVTLYTDVTARRRNEAARRDTERQHTAAPVQRTRFMDMIGAAMRAELDALADQPPGQPLGQPLGQPAGAHAARIRRLLDDAQEMSLLEAGEMTLTAAPFELRPMFEQVMADQRLVAEANAMQLELQVGADVPGWLMGDGARVARIVGALLQDAVHFARPGRVVLHVSRLGLGLQPILQVAVRDPGLAAHDDAAEQLFQPFARRVQAPDGAAPVGTGLELPIAAWLTELMRGKIGQVATSQGRELWVSLPLPVAEPGPQAQPGTAAPPSLTLARRSQRAFVLLVEDIVINQVVTATQLRREGHRVDVADDGASAIRLAASAPYDLVLMDLMMPGMSGLEAARHIRALPGPAGRTPIIALTANNSPEDHARCRAAGMLEMLGKPVRPAELSAALARALRLDDGGASERTPEPAQGDNRALLGIDRLTELRQNLPGPMFTRLAEQCLTELEQMLRALRDVLAAEQPAAVHAAAHALAGMAGGYGLVAIEARMRRIMAAAQAGDLDAARAAAAGMDDEALRSAAALRAMLADDTAAAA